MKLRPLSDRIVVRPDEAESKTPGGILLPDVAKEKPLVGVVLAVGPGKLNDKCEHVPVPLKVGSRVVFGRWAGADHEGLKVLKEEEVLAEIVPE